MGPGDNSRRCGVLSGLRARQKKLANHPSIHEVVYLDGTADWNSRPASGSRPLSVFPSGHEVPAMAGGGGGTFLFWSEEKREKLNALGLS
jgi:hypothetical protein